MKKVIYVEDDRDTAEAVKLVLELAGYGVELAFCGREGLAKIQQKTYDLALLDIMMPDMSGWDLFQKVRTKKMKFAFLSALPVSDERFKELKKAGISDYITKPFERKDLIARVKKMVG
jgi:DNA-binding response OmpR family regulator